MITFTQVLSNTSYTEVLGGGAALAFDCVAVAAVSVIFNETATAPSEGDTANTVHTWSSSWDFEVSGMSAGSQRIWLKGANTIIGIRG